MLLFSTEKTEFPFFVFPYFHAFGTAMLQHGWWGSAEAWGSERVVLWRRDQPDVDSCVSFHQCNPLRCNANNCGGESNAPGVNRGEASAKPFLRETCMVGWSLGVAQGAGNLVLQWYVWAIDWMLFLARCSNSTFCFFSDEDTEESKCNHPVNVGQIALLVRRRDPGILKHLFIIFFNWRKEKIVILYWSLVVSNFFGAFSQQERNKSRCLATIELFLPQDKGTNPM